MDSITNKQVIEIYSNQNGSADQKVSSTYAVLDDLCTKGNVSWEYSEKLFNRERKIRNLVKQRQAMRKSSIEEINKWEDGIFVELKDVEQQSLEVQDPEENRVEEKHVGPGRPKKRLSENPGDRTSNKILDEILNNLTCVAEEHNITTGALLRALSDRCAQRNGESREVTPDMPVLSACSLIYNVNLSLNQYQELRIELLSQGFMLPVRNDVDRFKKTLLPASIVSTAVKTSCDVQELIAQTVGSLLEIEKVSPDSELKVIAKFGLDGSGSHKIRHQNAEAEDDSGESIEEDEEKETTSYLGAFWCPLHVYCGDVLVWANPLPNSILFARPVCLMREKENRESVCEHFKPFMDKLAVIEKGLIPITTALPSANDTTDCSANIITEISMLDGKMADIIQGDAGAFCHYCNATRADANNIEQIKEGFQIEKSAEKCLETWQALESGEMPYHDKSRAGQVNEPLNNRNLRFYGITHQKLRSLDHMEKLLYHLVSGQTHTWSEREYRVKDALKAAKKETVKQIRKMCGFLMDTPTSGGGNTDTGGTADLFFSPEKRKDICSLILKESDRVAYSELLQLFNIVLSVCQHVDTSKTAFPSKVKDLCQELMIFHKTNFPWAMLSPSVHSMCGHNWELFVITKGAPIAIFSEQGSEAWNKHIRAYKSGPAARARQTSIKENILDIFNRMMIKTHPKIACQKRQLVCTRCNRLGHTIRSCPLRVESVLDWEATRVQSCFE